MPVSGLFEVPVAIEAVAETDEQLHRQDEEGIQHQFVGRKCYQQIGYGQFQYGFQNGNVGESRHFLVRDDVRIVRHAHNHHHGGHDRALQHPEGRIHPFGRNLHLRVHEPQPHRFAQDHDNGGNECMYLQGCTEHFL